MRIAILDPFSGISGDMTLGALLGVGLDPEWLRALPERMGLRGHRRRDPRGDARRPRRAGRWTSTSRRSRTAGTSTRSASIVARSGAPDRRASSRRTRPSRRIAASEAEIHGKPIEKVHLHEVGAVDAILDVVGAIWGSRELGVEEVRCGALRTGDGTVTAAHGILPVPAPATLKLLEGHRDESRARRGPASSSRQRVPHWCASCRRARRPRTTCRIKTGFGAGTKEFVGSRECASHHPRRRRDGASGAGERATHPARLRHRRHVARVPRRRRGARARARARSTS